MFFGDVDGRRYLQPTREKIVIKQTTFHSILFCLILQTLCIWNTYGNFYHRSYINLFWIGIGYKGNSDFGDP